VLEDVDVQPVVDVAAVVGPQVALREADEVERLLGSPSSP
jgi:hypothetical protein